MLAWIVGSLLIGLALVVVAYILGYRAAQRQYLVRLRATTALVNRALFGVSDRVRHRALNHLLSLEEWEARL